MRREHNRFFSLFHALATVVGDGSLAALAADILDLCHMQTHDADPDERTFSASSDDYYARCFPGVPGWRKGGAK